MRVFSILLAVLACLMLVSTAALAGYDVNIVDNNSFDQGRTGWEATDNVYFTVDQGITKWDQDSIAYDPAGANGEGGYLRQVVDCSKSGSWNAGDSYMLGDLSFWLYSTGTGKVQVGFGWWNDINRTKPMPGTNSDHYVILPTQYQSVDDWKQVTVPFSWAGQAGNNVPKWVVVEFYFMDVAGTGNEAGLDDIMFTSRTEVVPEPSSCAAMVSGLLGLGGILWKRRA